MGTIDCNDSRIVGFANFLCAEQNEDLINLCVDLQRVFSNITINRTNEFSGTSSGAQYDPDHGDIFDPDHGDIFDPEDKFTPQAGIQLRAPTENLYDSYGNRLHPKDSQEIILKLLSWIIKWDEFKSNPVNLEPITGTAI